MAQTWYDNTGTFQKFGLAKTVPTTGGEYRRGGRLHEIEFKIDLTTLTESETPLSDSVFFPKGARIQEIEVVATTAAATGTAIDFGLIKTDRSTEIDYNGLLAAFPTASMDAAGEKNTVTIGSSYVGALVGTTTAYPGYVTCSRTTSTAFTAGVIVVTIRFFVP